MNIEHPERFRTLYCLDLSNSYI